MDITLDNQYNSIELLVDNRTEGFTKEQGSVTCDNRPGAEIAKSILEDKYPNVWIENLDLDNDYGCFYRVFYNYKVNEAKKKSIITPNPGAGLDHLNALLDTSDGGASEALCEAKAMNRLTPEQLKTIELVTKSKPSITRQELEDDQEEEVFCSACDEPLTYIEGQGNYQMFICPECGTYYFQDQKGNLYSEDEMSYTEDGLVNEALTEEKHSELNPKFWEKDELKPEVKAKLFEIADKFEEYLEQDEIKLKIEDILFLGSNAAYNYTSKSDIDLHLVADLSIYKDREDLAEKLYLAYKSLWNNKYDPTIYGHEVEVYIEPEETTHKSSGVYSLYNGWLETPDPDDVPEEVDISAQVKEYTEKANQCKTIEQIDNFIDDLYKLRQSSLIDGGEFSEGNLIFKALRDKDVLQKLKDLKVELENKEMSL